MRILSIETSCDETAAAIIEWSPSSPSTDGSGRAGGRATVLVNTVSSQASLHAKWGGVVPNLAAREHTKNIVPVIEETLERAHLTPSDIDLIAVTQGPGLMPALLVGVTAAKTLALTWGKPLLGINHLEGHVYANFVGNTGSRQEAVSKREEIFPLVALIVSGGHTQLMLMQDHFQYELLGETQDDAAGEAFDKVAKMLGLPYPGGPIVAKRADNFRLRNSDFRLECENQENPKESAITNLQSAISFPRPMLDSGDYNFSFSGLKTSVLYFLKKHEDRKDDEAFVDMVCHEFQEAVVDVLVAKAEKAIRKYQPKTFTIAGGVSANVRLRERLENMVAEHFPDTRFSMPEFTYSLDNAAMIGVAAAYRYSHMTDEEKKALQKTFFTLEPNANLPLQ